MIKVTRDTAKKNRPTEGKKEGKRLVNSKPDLTKELELRGYSNDFIKNTVEKSRLR
jgi:hypothetical protein